MPDLLFGLWIALWAPWLPHPRRASCEDVRRGCGGKQVTVNGFNCQRTVWTRAEVHQGAGRSAEEYGDGMHTAPAVKLQDPSREVPAVIGVPQPHLRLVAGTDVRHG